PVADRRRTCQGLRADARDLRRARHHPSVLLRAPDRRAHRSEPNEWWDGGCRYGGGGVGVMHQMRRGFHVNVIGRSRTWFIVTALVMLFSIASLAVRGINAGLEFRGGTAFTAQAHHGGASIQRVRGALGKIGLTDATVQKVGANEIYVETKHLSTNEQQKAANA